MKLWEYFVECQFGLDIEDPSALAGESTCYCLQAILEQRMTNTLRRSRQVRDVRELTTVALSTTSSSVSVVSVWHRAAFPWSTSPEKWRYG